MPEHRDLASPNAFAHRFDQVVEIGNELLDGHRGLWNSRIERLTGAALVPVDDGEVLLQGCVEMAEEARLAEPRPAVQKDQRWIRKALATNHHPLIEPAEP